MGIGVTWLGLRDSLLSHMADLPSSANRVRVVRRLEDRRGDIQRGGERRGGNGSHMIGVAKLLKPRPRRRSR